MVTLIFEGADNLGKSTIINNIVNTNSLKDTKDITLMHCTGPRPAEGEDPFAYQNKVFQEKVMKINALLSTELSLSSSNKNLVILDRSWYGEYVYGQIYRNGNPENILGMIETCNTMMYSTVVVIYLCASPEFILEHDDNKSISSSCDGRLEKITRETELFDECFNKVNPEHYIKVNVEGENMQYRDINEIYNEIMKKIASCLHE